MRFKRKYYCAGDWQTFTYFAFLPVTLNGETRWLEKVTVKGYFSRSTLGGVEFNKTEFIDDGTE